MRPLLQRNTFSGVYRRKSAATRSEFGKVTTYSLGRRQCCCSQQQNAPVKVRRLDVAHAALARRPQHDEVGGHHVAVLQQNDVANLHVGNMMKRTVHKELQRTDAYNGERERESPCHCKQWKKGHKTLHVHAARTLNS